MTFTGKHIAGTPTKIEERQEEVNALYNKYFPVRKKLAPVVSMHRQNTYAKPYMEILEKARNGRGAKFTRLYDQGDWSG